MLEDALTPVCKEKVAKMRQNINLCSILRDACGFAVFASMISFLFGFSKLSPLD